MFQLVPNVMGQWLMRCHIALNSDFCPWANHWVYWLKNPFWVLCSAIVAAICCGLFVNPYMLAVALGLAAIVGLGVCWPWISMRGLSCRLRFDSNRGRGREGDPVLVHVEIVNRWFTPAWGLHLAGGFGWEQAGDRQGMALTWVGGWSRVDVPWWFTPTQRGVFPLGPVELETGFPFGLHHARRPVEVEGELIVWPRTVSLRELPDSRSLVNMESATASRRLGPTGDFCGSRPFRQGDSLRSVHWALSARQGTLVVNEREESVACRVELVLDLAPESHLGEGPHSSFERMIRVAASIVSSLHGQHAIVDCRWGRTRLQVGSSSADWRRCLDELARLKLGEPGEAAVHGPLEGGGARLVLTTERGWPRWQPFSRGSRSIIVADAVTEGRNTRADRIGGEAWLLPAEPSALEQLPHVWKRLCHAA